MLNLINNQSALDIAPVPLKHSAVASVVIENLSKVFQGPRAESFPALTNLNLTVAAGELLVLVGPSGSGKSTTLRLIAGLEELTSGAISIDGQVVNKIPPGDRNLSMVFQNPALYPHLTIYENLAFGLKIRKIARAEIERRVKEAVDMLDLGECLQRLPAEISGGQRQRVALGRALVRQAKVVLFDEPLSNLDAPLRAQMRREIAALHRRLGVTMIYVTHDQVEAMTLGQRIAVMKSGRLQQVAGPMTLYKKPENLFVAGFIGSPAMNFFGGTLTGSGDHLNFKEKSAGGQNSGFEIALLPETASRLGKFAGKEIILGIRPEHILAGGASDHGGAIQVEVESVERLGAETYLYGTSGTHKIAARATGQIPALGQKLACHFDLSKIHFFEGGSENAI